MTYPIIRTFSAKIYRKCSLTYRLISKALERLGIPESEACGCTRRALDTGRVGATQRCGARS